MSDESTQSHVFWHIPAAINLIDWIKHMHRAGELLE